MIRRIDLKYRKTVSKNIFFRGYDHRLSVGEPKGASQQCFFGAVRGIIFADPVLPIVKMPNLPATAEMFLFMCLHQQKRGFCCLNP